MDQNTSDNDSANNLVFAKAPTAIANDTKMKIQSKVKIMKINGKRTPPRNPPSAKITPNATTMTNKKASTEAIYFPAIYCGRVIGYVFNNENQPDSTSPAMLILPIVKINRGNKTTIHLKRSRLSCKTLYIWQCHLLYDNDSCKTNVKSMPTSCIQRLLSICFNSSLISILYITYGSPFKIV